MEFKSELLLQSELDGEVVRNLDGLTVVLTGNPLGHSLDNAFCLTVEGGVRAADCLDVGDRTVFTYGEVNGYFTLDAFFSSGSGVFDVV